MIGGHTGKLLFVDLHTGKTRVEEPGEALYVQYLGGNGLGSFFLYRRQKPGIDPLEPDNVVGILAGPLSGAPVVGGTRFCLVGKSPLTGSWGEANCGGYFGPALKASGYDGVFFEGVSEKPVYLLLEDGNADVRDAEEIWGSDCYDTEDALKRQFGENAEVACIGPSGEKMSRISGVIHAKGRAAARCGLGAIMGSKRVKAVVARGRLRVPVADPERARILRKKYLSQIMSGVGFSNFYRMTGTPGYIEPGALNGDSPTKNWGGVGPIDFKNPGNLSYESILKYRVKKHACWRCPIACWGTVRVSEGPYIVEEAHQPEYETAAAFGSNCLMDDLPALIRCNDICNRYGLDTISAGSVVAFAIECYESGILKISDTDGLELTWGNAGAIVSLLEKIAKREGIGDVLADGVRLAAKRIGGGSEQFAVHVGGQEPGMHDPRFEPSMAVIYKIDAAPGRHTAASQYTPPPGLAEALGIEIPGFGERPTEFTGRAKAHRVLAALSHCVNSSGICLFPYLSTAAEMLPESLSAVTGVDLDLAALIEIGERIEHVRHAFNLREGINPLKRHFSGRPLGMPPLKDGPRKGLTLDLDLMVRELLEEMNWDPQTAKPSKEKLLSLGLENVASDLYDR